MKKYIIITLTLVLILGTTATAKAESGAFWFSGGCLDGNGSLSMGFGGKNLGVEFGMIDDSTLPDGTLDYECPHWDYTSLGSQRLGSTVGFDLIGMIHLSDNILFYGGPGIYWYETGEVVRSNATGWLYTQTVDTYTELACSGGVKFRLTEGTRLGIGYHSLRGTNLIFQLCF
ncbi:MAG: hypothetical protein GXY86_06975 [Firmicutes bacterium]|nr:hypothetical protein [Bacillota bacterium]